MSATSQTAVRKALQEMQSSLPAKRSSLIPALQVVQENLGWIPKEAMAGIGEYLRIPASEVWGTASFYAQFRFSPVGRNIVTVCRGTACHVRGSAKILKDMEKKLGISAGETAPDLSFTLQQVACFGSCALAPVMVINDKVCGTMTVDKSKKLLVKYARGEDKGRKAAKHAKKPRSKSKRKTGRKK
ncbi:MAG: NADH-quinone oxidoreductase subunit NuoE [Pseudomonadota bacterium]